jgi:hypothetical protein
MIVKTVTLYTNWPGKTELVEWMKVYHVKAIRAFDNLVKVWYLDDTTEVFESVAKFSVVPE